MMRYSLVALSALLCSYQVFAKRGLLNHSEQIKRTCCEPKNSVGGDVSTAVCDDSGYFKQVLMPNPCPTDMVRSNYMPGDVEKVAVEIFKYDVGLSCSDRGNSKTLVSKFELGNAGNSEMSGSLDNIDQGCYHVDVKMFHRGENQPQLYIRGVAGQDLLMFVGTAEVAIKGDGSNSLARIVLVSVAPDMVIPNVPKPQFPAYIMSITQDGGVLKAGEKARLDIKVNNNNNARQISAEYGFDDIEYSNTRVEVQLENFGKLDNDLSTPNYNPYPKIYMREGAAGTEPAGNTVDNIIASNQCDETDNHDQSTCTRNLANNQNTHTYFTRVYKDDSDTAVAGDSNDMYASVVVSADGSSSTSSHQVSFQPFSCPHINRNGVQQRYCGVGDTDDSDTYFRRGRKEKFTITIAPVGDLDLQLVILSKFKCVSERTFLGPDQVTSANFGCLKPFQQSIGGSPLFFNEQGRGVFDADNGKCTITEEITRIFQNDPHVNFPRTVIESGASTFDLYFQTPESTRDRASVFEITGSDACATSTALITSVQWSSEAPYTANSLQVLQPSDNNYQAPKEMKFTKVVQRGSFDDNKEALASFNNFDVNGGDNQKFTFTIPGASPMRVFQDELLYIKVTVTVSPKGVTSNSPRAFCDHNIQGQTTMIRNGQDNVDPNTPLESGFSAQKLTYQTLGSEFFCGGDHNMEALVNGIKHKTCPVMKNIQWGSTDNYAKVCDKKKINEKYPGSYDIKPQQIKMCVYKTEAQNIAPDEQIDADDSFEATVLSGCGEEEGARKRKCCPCCGWNRWNCPAYNPPPPPPPVNCQWSGYTGWDSCSLRTSWEFGYAYQKRRYRWITVNAQNGGAGCGGRDDDFEVCVTASPTKSPTIAPTVERQWAPTNPCTYCVSTAPAKHGLQTEDDCSFIANQNGHVSFDWYIGAAEQHCHPKNPNFKKRCPKENGGKAICVTHPDCAERVSKLGGCGSDSYTYTNGYVHSHKKKESPGSNRNLAEEFGTTPMYGEPSIKLYATDSTSTTIDLKNDFRCDGTWRPLVKETEGPNAGKAVTTEVFEGDASHTVSEVCPELFADEDRQGVTQGFKIHTAWEVTFEWSAEDDHICDTHETYDADFYGASQKLFFHVEDEARDVALIPTGDYESDDLRCHESVIDRSTATTDDDFEQLMCTYSKDLQGACAEPECQNKCYLAYKPQRWAYENTIRGYRQTINAAIALKETPPQAAVDGIAAANKEHDDIRTVYDDCVAACTGDRKRRSLLQAQHAPGCDPDSPYACPADNNLPFDIKVEDGRLTVSMDIDDFGSKTLTVSSDPKGRMPKRTQFIASDFSQKLQKGSDWSSTLQNKVDRIFNSPDLKKNLIPGVQVSDLVACCGLSEAEAEQLFSFMESVVVAEKTAFYVPRINPNNGEPKTQTQTQTQSHTTTTTTTEKSSGDSGSSGTLLVVVAVAGILVLVAVVALVVVQSKSKATVERVVDMRQRSSRQASWQKGGAVDMDF